jgi:rhamnose transport system ATP-binding protein
LKALLQLTNVTKSFGAVRALKGVSFDLQAGEVHALLGENGAGKSTLIKLITGAHQPDGGRIEIAGEVVKHLTPAGAHRLGITCIYQQPALFPDLTVAENIGLRLEKINLAHRVDWKKRQVRAEELLKRIGAEIDPETDVRQLTMPQQQLVEIACALGAGARIVIMDEPTASLTQQEQRLLFGVVRELRANGVGVIYISHRLEEIFALADRVTVLRDGESVGTRRMGGNRVLPHPDPLPLGEGDTDPVSRVDLSVSEGGITEFELIKLMVGREVTHIYPPSESVAGDVVLALKKVGCAEGGIEDVSLEVRAGEIVGLAGLVGAGRTELARTIFGITPADAGEIWLNGKAINVRSPQDATAQGIAYVPEDRRRHGVTLDMPIAANISMAIHRQLFPGTWLRASRERALALDYIRELSIRTSGPDAPGSSLSGGNQQKVALARWLSTKPKLLILDEPTQGVDVGAKSEIHRLIRQFTKEGLAVLMISSDLPEILGMSDRIAVMRGGTMVAMLQGKSEAHDVMAAALGQVKEDKA